MGVGAGAVLALLALGAKRKETRATDCEVSAVYSDGHEETRECYVMADDFLKKGTKGRFESCTA